jgi:hypothetical protein
MPPPPRGPNEVWLGDITFIPRRVLDLADWKTGSF